MDFLSMGLSMGFGFVVKHAVPLIPNAAIPYINAIGGAAAMYFFGGEGVAGNVASAMEAGAIMASQATFAHQIIKMPVRALAKKKGITLSI